VLRHHLASAFADNGRKTPVESITRNPFGSCANWGGVQVRDRGRRLSRSGREAIEAPDSTRSNGANEENGEDR